MAGKPVRRLNYIDRCSIEEGLRQGFSFAEISRRVGVSKPTIKKEIIRNRTPTQTYSTTTATTRNVCVHQHECDRRGLCNNGCVMRCSTCKQSKCNKICADFEEARCPRLSRPPYVCNTCHERFGFGCNFGYRFYDAKLADEKAQERSTISRRGIDCSEEELRRMVEIIKPLIKKGQSIEHIIATHSDEITVSTRTLYRYIARGCLDVANLDLPRKMRYKPRKSKEPKPQRRDISGRSYEDFQELPLEKQYSAVEMDCVMGKMSDKCCILTLLFRRYNFQIMMLLPEHTCEQVAHALDNIEILCGGEFSKHFETILTDRGSEFINYELLERSIDGGRRCHVYYCDPMKSGQKGSCEKNHSEIRRILPKGTSFKEMTPRKLAIISSHVNSYKRPSLGGVAPLALASLVLPSDLIDGLGLELIPPDEIVLKPSLYLGLKGDIA